MFSLATRTLCVRASSGGQGQDIHPAQVPAKHILRAIELADSYAGLTAPHPNAGCVIAHGPRVVGEGFLYAQGTRSAEVQAVERARDLTKGAIAYLNLEPGDCHGDDSALTALIQAKVSKVVVGLRHPLKHLRGKAIQGLRAEGIAVDVLGEDLIEGDQLQDVTRACQLINAPLLCRAVQRLPYSVLKYAMTLDGKIAASTGHAAWVSSSESRRRVFETRGRSDAVIVGGNTVRRDNPRLTTRRDGGHLPVRIVMSRCLTLPDDANVWNVANAPTIVMTQRGARREFQAQLIARGVEVVEFDFLTPKAVMDYCFDRGFLSVMWECGGTLSAPAIASGVIHKVIAFVAPKIIGGVLAPSPVGELGMVEMTQALNLSDVAFEQTGPDMLVTGYLQPVPALYPPVSTSVEQALAEYITPSTEPPAVISFYKTWDLYGAFSNFSPHPISVPDDSGKQVAWNSVEHYYQAHKFVGVDDPLAKDRVLKIQFAASPEEAARLGRTFGRERPDLLRPDWDEVKMEVMYKALRLKFTAYESLNRLLLSTAGSVLVEASPNDLFWGAGRTGAGKNHLGLLLMKLRAELTKDSERKQKPVAQTDSAPVSA
ncbi:hypothetical protein R1sor_017054 [Riccia sorocarpa]|uniref:5-amino-6-(5-phosphoribosylamino)uracil reductase n=1 Tax=Riccia sorocarpa TaxID=122646 RepID=A0ABD3I5P2_9MARC